MAIIGMDVEAATGHATSLQTNGIDALHNLITQLDSTVNGLMDAWKGTDAGNFQSDWQSSHKPNLTTIQAALTDFHTKLNQNIQAQVDTSAS